MTWQQAIWTFVVGFAGVFLGSWLQRRQSKSGRIVLKVEQPRLSLHLRDDTVELVSSSADDLGVAAFETELSIRNDKEIHVELRDLAIVFSQDQRAILTKRLALPSDGDVQPLDEVRLEPGQRRNLGTVGCLIGHPDDLDKLRRSSRIHLTGSYGSGRRFRHELYRFDVTVLADSEAVEPGRGRRI